MSAPAAPFWIKFFSSCGFLGYVPVAPGTAGSLGGIAIYLAIIGFGGEATSFLITAAAVTLFAMWISSLAEKLYGRKDPQKIVIDEVAGMLITLIAVPPKAIYIVIGFVLFRFLDVVKIPPARQCEKLPGGVGIVMDDVVSGIYAWGILQGIILLTHL